ncbi:MAG: phytanoyl-CoA dioxygenase family protein [Leptolyngbyaceae cyanobacterium SM1_3_5]|nr:phytanoyl-CoA dioxygenase family protein [Leptolyngbyaceae cyanobacterium SM1_3_5]
MNPIELSAAQIEQFREQGFLVLEKFLDRDRVSQIDDRLDPLFATRFETGIYPDEWHGRPGLSRPEATRQMVGMWRCDRTVASLSLSAEIARLNATLVGWSGGRLAMDSCWIKPPNAPAVLFHRNSTLVSCIAPSEIVTCWIALSETTKEMGTIELIPGSHRWLGQDQFRFLHAPEVDYRQPVWDLGIHDPEILAIELPPGGCVFLQGDLWRGSSCNLSDRTRRSIAVSTLRSDAQFQPIGVGTGYIFSRYRRLDSLEMDESFFPILWTQAGYRSAFAQAYCEDLMKLG